MLVNELQKIAETKKVYVYFDMDGVLAEYHFDKEYKRNQPGTNFYANSRPVYYTLNVAKKLASINNIEVGIISNCHLNEQIEQKINWLKKYAPFIKPENIHIICYENITFQKEEKCELKTMYLKENISNGYYCILIEDDIRNINAINKYFNANVAWHISSIIE